MKTKQRQRETIPQTSFTWNPQLNIHERERYEEVRAEKIRKEEPWRDPVEIRENFTQGYIEKMEETKHD